MSKDQVADKNLWVYSCNGHAPSGTLVGGYDVSGEPIYMASAFHNGDLIPGKLIASHHCMYVAWGGKEYKKNEYEVLVRNSNKWISTSCSNIPSEALPAGRTQTGEILYVGRVRYNGTITTGKVHKSQRACYISYGGEQLKFRDYEVLSY